MVKTKLSTKKTKQKKSVKKKKTKKMSYSWFKFIFVSFSVVFIALSGFIAYCYFTLPDINQAVSRTRAPSTTIIAENGNEIVMPIRQIENPCKNSQRYKDEDRNRCQKSSFA